MPLSALGAPDVADLELLRRIAARDEGAVELLYDRYGRMLYALAWRILGRRADAEEAVMETFAQAWHQSARFELARGSVAVWLAMLTRSRALDLARSRTRRFEVMDAAAEAADGVPGMSAQPRCHSEAPERSEETGLIASALQQLSSPQRQAIELAFYEGLSQSQIAHRLNLPLGTIKTRVRLGMQRLRDALRPHYLQQEA